jgi:hypothetical protein
MQIRSTPDSYGFSSKHLLLRESSPCGINVLLLNKMIEIEVLVKLVRLGSRITEETLLVELFRSLQ